MMEPRIRYDAEGDILSISFRPGELAMGINLTEHILLRLHPDTHEVVGLTLLDFSVLVQPTEIGPRSFPLRGLNELPDALRKTVMTLLTTPPVNRFVKVSLYTPSSQQQVPLVYIERTAMAIPA